jgi:hypothetical protein
MKSNVAMSDCIRDPSLEFSLRRVEGRKTCFGKNDVYSTKHFDIADKVLGCGDS